MKYLKGSFFITILFIFFACKNNKTMKTYYDTGELKTIEILIDKKDSVWFEQKFLKNGKLKWEGNRVQNTPDGYWKYYYSDGSLMWQGVYDMGVPEYLKNGETFNNYNNLKVKILFENDIRSFEIGVVYKFRTVIENLIPGCYVVTDASCKQLEVGDIWNDDFPYTFLFTEEDYENCLNGKTEHCVDGLTMSCDTVSILLHLHNENDNVIIPNNHIIVFKLPIKIGSVGSVSD